MRRRRRGKGRRRSRLTALFWCAPSREGKQGCSQFHCGSRCARTGFALKRRCRVKFSGRAARTGTAIWLLSTAGIVPRSRVRKTAGRSSGRANSLGPDGALAAEALSTPWSERLRSTNHSKRFSHIQLEAVSESVCFTTASLDSCEWGTNTYDCDPVDFEI